MSKLFYPIWLPISLIINIILLLILQFMPLKAAQIPGTVLSRVGLLVEQAPSANQTQPPPPELVKPVQINKVSGSDIINPPKVKNPTGYRGPLDKTKTLKQPSGPGKGAIPAAAPAVIAGSGNKLIPKGTADGVGTGGTGTEPEGGGIGGGETRGVTINKKYCGSYPKDALNNNEEGTVTVSVTVAADGHVVDALISNGATALLNNAALRFAKRSIFIPALNQGKETASSITIEYRFYNGKVY